MGVSSILLLDVVEKVEAGDHVLVVDEGERVASEDPAELVELGLRGDASELLDDYFFNLVVQGHFPFNQLSRQDCRSEAADGLALSVADWELIVVVSGDLIDGLLNCHVSREEGRIVKLQVSYRRVLAPVFARNKGGCA